MKIETYEKKESVHLAQSWPSPHPHTTPAHHQTSAATPLSHPEYRPPPRRARIPMASVSPAAAAAAVSGPHHGRLLLPSSPRRLPRPRPRPRARLRLVACHADTLLPSSSSSAEVRAPPAPAAGPSSESATDCFVDWLRASGLPGPKVDIRERPVPCLREGKYRPLRYVAAADELQVSAVGHRF